MAGHYYTQTHGPGTIHKYVMYTEWAGDGAGAGAGSGAGGKADDKDARILSVNANFVPKTFQTGI